MALHLTSCESAPEQFFVLISEWKYGEEARLFRTQEDARAALVEIARDEWNDRGDARGEPDDDEVVEWFQNHDGTYIASVYELSVEA